MSISITDAQALFTKKVVEVYSDSKPVTSFLRSFFKDRITDTKEISILTQRFRELVAKDATIGDLGHSNTMNKSGEKIFQGILKKEYFEMTELHAYDAFFRGVNFDGGLFKQLVNEASDELNVLIRKIERSHELQCAQVLDTGIIIVDFGVNYDFKRLAASKVDKGTGAYWDIDTVDPYKDLIIAAKFLRETGKASGGSYNAIFGESAIQAFLNNKIVKDRANIRNFKLDDIVGEPQKETVGSTYHGTVSAGPYDIHMWSYPQSYETTAGVNTPYINTKKVIVLPENPTFIMGYCAVPQLIKSDGTIKTGKYVIDEYTDARRTSHVMQVQSNGLAIPVSVDKIHTTQVIA